MPLCCWGQSRISTYQIIEDETYFQMEMDGLTLYGYVEKPFWKQCLLHVIFTFLFGVPYVVLGWYPKLHVLCFYTKASLNEATHLLVWDCEARIELVKIQNNTYQLPQFRQAFPLRYFIYNRTRYIWLTDQNRFSTITDLIPSKSLHDYLCDTNGLPHYDYQQLRDFYGENRIEIIVKSYTRLFFDEVFNPFYIFQLFSIILWCFDDYVLYAGCVLVLTLFSAVTSLLQTRRQSVALSDLVESSKGHLVTVLRRNSLNEQFQITLNATDLVPGDLIVLPKGDFLMPADCLLLNGQCIVNESMLTGESVPVTKIAPHLSHESYNGSLHRKYTLFSGTRVIQSRYYGGEPILGRVLSTGFETTKGALIKSILYPSPVGLKFYTDGLKFVLVLFAVALIGTGYCLYLYIIRNAKISEIIIRSLDIVTIVVPPALPAAMTVGTVYSQNRLKAKGIFCTSPPRIIMAGRIKLICFDKTGTLTRDGLDMYSVVPSGGGVFKTAITEQTHLFYVSKQCQAMATCHSLTRIDNNLNGDPLDLTMFNFTKWNLEEGGAEETTRFDLLAPTVVVSPSTSSTGTRIEIGILRQFPFSSSAQCMSVICRSLNEIHMEVYTKGAPEKIAGLCRPNSLPSNFADTLSYYTVRGFRVIALAHKNLSSKLKWTDAQRIKRELIECDLHFLGLLIMQNALKPETTPIIQTLQKANIRTIMITGDNILTAISVSRDCGMVKENEEISIVEVKNSCEGNETVKIQPFTNHTGSGIRHFAIDGKTWSKIITNYPAFLPELLVRTTIFARFQPDQKTQLISHLQDLDYVVAMVGDGANDCGALKAAHVGVSLSEAEASVAAPFTSALQNISCIFHLILEGRCALVTSFSVFKYMALYSLIQFFTVLLLYRVHSILGDTQFLYIDLVITTSLAITIGKQGPANDLHAKRPSSSLVGAKTLIPLVLQAGFCATSQIMALFYLQHQKWYHPLRLTASVEDKGTEGVIQCWENTVLFTVSCFQYIILACVYAKGAPYRRNMFTNYAFVAVTVLLISFGTILTVLHVSQMEPVRDFFQLMHVHGMDQNRFCYGLLGFGFVHFVGAFSVENWCADTIWLRKIVRFLRRKNASKSKYKILSNTSVLSPDLTIVNTFCNL